MAAGCSYPVGSMMVRPRAALPSPCASSLRRRTRDRCRPARPSRCASPARRAASAAARDRWRSPRPSTFGFVARMTSVTPPADRARAGPDLQIVGTDALQRRQRAHQHVIDTLELARPLDRRDVLRLFDDADEVLVAVRARAVRARVGVGDAVADRAVGDAILQLADRVGQPLGLFARRLQDVKREPLRALRADAGQALQLLDEANKRLWKERQSD